MSDKLLSTQEAAELMHKALPQRQASQWASWLANNRDSSTDHAHRVPHQRFGRGVAYKEDDVEFAALFLLENPTNIPTDRIGARKTQEVETPVAQNPRPGLEMALKIVRNLPEGITAEQALLIALNTVQ